jgi:hypothetical protein
MYNVPDVLTSLSGIKIDSKELWEKYRRDEVLGLCERYVYGIRDIERPEDLFFNVESVSEVYGMTCKEIRGGFGDYSFPFKVYLPKSAKEPVPVMIYVMHENLENKLQFQEDGNMFSEELESYLPLKYATDRGYAVAAMPTRELYREWNTRSEYKVGVFAAVNNKYRTKYSWASISAWAWGVSRVMDYLETDPQVDATRVGVTGHSRSGKAALWAGATDERIFLVAPNNSGCMGAALLRGKKGEHAVKINISDWFCPKFKEFNDNEDILPMDQHMVLALCAPRNMYITDSILDEWADPDAELRSAQLASPVWELYGKKGVIMSDEAPVVNKVYQEGTIAFHVKEGDHSQTMFDWENLLDYFDKIK